MRPDLHHLAERAAARMGPGTACSITVGRPGATRQVGSNDARAAELDRLEVDLDDGPCILAMRLLSGVLVTDIGAEERWPDWRDLALAHGFRSAVALPAVVDEDATVAFNIYSSEPDPWDEDHLVRGDDYVQAVAAMLRGDGLAPA